MRLFRRIGNEVIFLRAALRTLKRINAIHASRSRTFADIIEDFAREKPDNVAIYFENRKITYRELNMEANRYAHWVAAQGIGQGDSVALLMENRPEYLSAWLGIIKAGATAALVNTNLTSGSLAHCLDISGAGHVVLGAELAEQYASAVDMLARPVTCWATGGLVQGAKDLDQDLNTRPVDNMPAKTRADLTIDDGALYIYTSGTTGNPKAARIPHVRLLSMMAAFSTGPHATEKDRMYICLPLYHSAGGICAVGSVLTVGGAIIIRRKFSAREFWDDVVKYEATLFQYIGELCRYLLNTPVHPLERAHKLRVVMGNGLRPEIWEKFRQRFKIPHIIEFYGATEGNVSLMNFDGTSGSVGRIPAWARSKYNVELVKFDIEKEAPVRDGNGFCIRCKPGEAGEALGEISNDPAKPTGRFDGYATREETEKKILRNVFTQGDAWFRSGDLLKQDKLGYFYFIDRIGDTFRWKGENVATSEVAEVMSVFPGVEEANVYGVPVPGADGRAGMASIVGQDVDIDGLYAHIAAQLPEYARPLFLRLQNEMVITGTFKHRKTDLVREGFDPAVVREALYYNDAGKKAFVPLDPALYEKICGGEIRF